MSPPSAPNKKIKSHIRAFAFDIAGVAAVEFAFLAPVLMLMTFGTFEVSRALMAHKRFQRATAMVGDLVAREKQIGSDTNTADAAMNGMLDSAEHAMEPFSSSSLQIGVTQLRASSTDADNTTVEWSWAYHDKILKSCGEKKSMPDKNMISKGDAAIIIEAQYTYEPLLANILPSITQTMTWSDTMTFAPRWGAVYFAQDKLNTKCPPGSG